jgi:hypothetical protein
VVAIDALFVSIYRPSPTFRSMYFVPLELVREIIASAFDDATSSEEHGMTSKPLWSSIESLTLASKAYRALVLEHWFRTFFIKSSDDLSPVQSLLPEIKRGWTRHVHDNFN